MITTSAVQVARRYIGIKEVVGTGSHPLVLWMLQRIGSWVQDDDTAWCAAFVGFIAFTLGLEEPMSLAARSWLKVGQPVALAGAVADCDVVILKRGTGVQPGPEVLDAPGHVGWYIGRDGDKVLVLAGNQSNQVNIQAFPITQVLGVRRLGLKK
jgi:uncharacterized protein (TIGR02594 family)